MAYTLGFKPSPKTTSLVRVALSRFAVFPEQHKPRGFSIILHLYTGSDSAGPVSTLAPPSWWPQNASRIEVPRRYTPPNAQQGEPDATGGVSGPELGPKMFDVLLPPMPASVLLGVMLKRCHACVWLLRLCGDPNDSPPPALQVEGFIAAAESVIRSRGREHAFAEWCFRRPEARRGATIHNKS
jgi:hypothetical protein